MYTFGTSEVWLFQLLLILPFRTSTKLMVLSLLTTAREFPSGCHVRLMLPLGVDTVPVGFPVLQSQNLPMGMPSGAAAQDEGRGMCSSVCKLMCAGPAEEMDTTVLEAVPTPDCFVPSCGRR